MMLGASFVFYACVAMALSQKVHFNKVFNFPRSALIQNLLMLLALILILLAYALFNLQVDWIQALLYCLVWLNFDILIIAFVLSYWPRALGLLIALWALGDIGQFVLKHLL